MLNTQNTGKYVLKASSKLGLDIEQFPTIPFGYLYILHINYKMASSLSPSGGYIIVLSLFEHVFFQSFDIGKSFMYCK